MFKSETKSLTFSAILLLTIIIKSKILAMIFMPNYWISNEGSRIIYHEELNFKLPKFSYCVWYDPEEI